MAFDATLWGQQATHTINVGQVPSSQSNVPLLITKSLANFPSSMLDGGSTSALNGGGDIRVSTDTAGANQLPVEIVSCVTSATPASQELIMWVRAPTVVDSGVIYITWNRAGQSQPPVTDPFGRNAVWQDFIGVYHFQNTSWTDSSGNGDLTVDGSNPPSIVSTSEGLGVEFVAADSTFLTRAISQSANPVTLQLKGITTVLSASVMQYAMGFAAAPVGTDFSFGFRAGSLGRGLGSITPSNTSYISSILSGGGITGDVVYGRSHWLSDDSLAMRGYFDGNLLTGSSSNARSTTFTKMGVGGRIDGSPDYYSFILNEAWFSENEVTDDRVDTEYNNQSDQNAWATIGTPYNPGAGSGINVSVAVVNYDITALATDVNTPYDVLATASNYDINALTATVSFSGAVDVNVLPVNYDITALATTVAVSGDIDVIPQPANISYTAIGATVSLFGTIDVNIAVTNYNIEAYQAYVQNETISVECICGYEGVITTSINFDGIITGDIGLNGLIDDSDINRVGAIDNSDLAFKGGLCHCE